MWDRTKADPGTLTSCLELRRLALAAVWVALVAWPTPGRSLEWQPGAGFRSAPLAIPESTPAREGFTLLRESQTGIAFTNHLSNAAVAQNQIRLVGSGVALGDVDGDGWCDIYLCRLEGPNVL